MTISNGLPSFPDGCRSLLCKYLSEEVFEHLNSRKTTRGYSFWHLINSGVINPDSSIGVYAGDEDSYITFAALLDPIIQEYHGFSKNDNHVSHFCVDDLNAPNPDPAGDYILSTRIRCGRNLAGFPMGTTISREQREEVEQLATRAFADFHGSLAGSYHSLHTMSESNRTELIEAHLLFKTGDRFLDAAGLNRDWPNGRGIYHNDERTFLVWVNEEDQFRIISMQKGGDIKSVFTRLCEAMTQLENQLQFAYNDHLGYLSSCPTNLGTAMRSSVHIRLPKLAENMSKLKLLTDQHSLQIRGVHGEHTDSEGGIFDISNRRRLGVTEVDCVQDLYNGVVALIAAEKMP